MTTNVYINQHLNLRDVAQRGNESMALQTGRIYGAHELSGARSSVVSLASNTTGASNNSWGSGSTITRDSAAKSRHSGEKRRKSRRKDDVDARPDRKPEVPASGDMNPDVFNFLVDTEESAPLSPELNHTVPQTGLQLKETPSDQRPDSEMENYYRAHLTDAGISMESSHGESHLDVPTKHPLPPLIEEAADRATYGEYHKYGPPTAESVFHHEPQMWNHYPAAPYTPEPVPLSPASVRSYAYPHDYTYRGTPDPPSTGDSNLANPNPAPLVFSDRVSRKTTRHPQLFRSFAKISQKVLLQMQANIAELEQELISLDAKTVANDVSPKLRHRKVEPGRGTKQSRKDQARRADLYQELRSSLEQYYEALSSFHRISELTVPSQPAELASLKSWLKYSILPSFKVAGLVGDGSDLVRLGRPESDAPDDTLRVMAYSVFTNVFIPLLLFKLTSGVLSRLILLSSTTCLTILALDRYRANSLSELGQLYWRCIIACVGISFVAALVF